MLALVGAITFELILPFAWKRWQRELPFDPRVIMLACWLASAGLFYVVVEPIRIRARQWRRVLWYPPMWSAVAAAWILAAQFERLRPLERSASAPIWTHVFPIAPIAAALALAIIVRQFPWRSRRASTLGAVQPLTWDVIRQWMIRERPVGSAEPDLFGHRRIATKVARAAGHDGLSVALLGGFGTGKSTILNAVRSELESGTPLTIVAQFDVWAIPHPEDVPRLALNRILSAVDAFADTIELRGLPLSYQRLAAAEPTGLASKVLGVQSADDSIEEVGRLMPILEALNARVVLIIEDAERAGDGFETRHLERLLWTLRGFRRISFIVAAERNRTQIDFAKLCDTVELLPQLTPSKVLSVLMLAYSHWLAEFTSTDIDPHRDRENADKLGLRAATIGGMMDYLSRTGKATPLDALTSLLSTPRALKHVMRHVDRTWQSLHGEVELDDVIIIAALRFGAQSVYDFLIDDIDPARHKPDDMLPRTKSVKADWERIISEVPDGTAAQQLVNLLGIEQLTGRRAVGGRQAPQGVHVSEPVDYFRRITGEELSPGELRDQEVLHDIDNWNAGQSLELVRKLVAATEENESYSGVWEHFSDRHTEQQLADLTSQVAAAVLARDGVRAAADHRALIALWRRCNRRFTKDEYAIWLQNLMLTGIPVSLEFVNSLFYYWTGDHGIVTGAASTTIRDAAAEALRATVRSGDALASRLNPEHPYQVGRFITQTGRQIDAATFGQWRDYFSAILIDGARRNPDVVMPEIANLAGDAESGMVAAKEQYPPAFINRYRMDRERMEALFGGDLNQVLALLAEYTGENPWALRAKDEATAWLQERRIAEKSLNGG